MYNNMMIRSKLLVGIEILSLKRKIYRGKEK